MEKYRYNDLTARHEKVNHVFLLGSDLLFVVMAVYFWLYSQEVGRPMWTVWVNCAVLGLVLIVNTVLYHVNKSTKILRIVVSAEVIGVYIFYSMATPASFLGMALMGIMGISIAYFESGFFNTLFVLCSLVYIICQIIRSSVGVTEANANGVCQIVMNLAIFVMLQRIASITKVFNDHSLGAIADQKELQDQMMSEMLDISQIVKDESDRSRDMVQRLLSSVQQTAMNSQEISRMSDSIAEDLEEQTRMTREIQDAIAGTKARSGEMVTVAADSNQQIAENHVMMNELRQHSDHIAATNAQVTRAMERLQQKTGEVAGFADVILNVSSQTNLLALNAAVESARAGEAGKGFSVIAGQIRQLAEETRKSAENITTIVGELRANEKEVVELVGTSVEASDKQNGMIRKTTDMVEGLGKNLGRLIASIDEIDGKIENLSISNDTMVDSISKISGSTEEVSANAEETKGMTARNLRYARTTSAAINSIQEAASRLEQYI